MQRNFLQSVKISRLWRGPPSAADLVKRPLIMGILNITPDSFSDSGKCFHIKDAIKHAKELIGSGIDIIDVGGESTRPGANYVPEEEELRRVIPVINELSKLKPHFLISIDTYKSNVASAAIQAGANIINDVSGLIKDPDMVKVAAKYRCPIVIMHNKGIPASKPDCRGRSLLRPSNGSSEDLINEISQWLKKQTDYAIENGIKHENIIIDPGIGFGKTQEEDLYLIEHLQRFKSLGFPILVGASKKLFIKKLFPNDDLESKNKEIIELAIKNGADIVRVH